MCTYLVEDGLVGAKEAPPDVALAQANVEHLAVRLGIGVVPVGFAVAGKTGLGDLGKILSQNEDCSDHDSRY